MTRFIYPPTASCSHDNLPSEMQLQENTLARCWDCGDWFRVAYQYQGFGGANAWHHVRWYHWRLRRRIKDWPGKA